MVKSPTTVCNEIYTELRKMKKHFESADVLLRVNPETVKVLKANNGSWLTEFEELVGQEHPHQERRHPASRAVRYSRVASRRVSKSAKQRRPERCSGLCCSCPLISRGEWRLTPIVIWTTNIIVEKGR